MSMTFSEDTFYANSIKSGMLVVPSFLEANVFSDNDAVKISLDGVTYAYNIRLTNPGTYTLYVKTGDIVGTVTDDILGYYLYDGGSSYEEAYFPATFIGSEPIVERLNFSFQPRNATIQYNAELINTPISVGGSVGGTILDHVYDFEAERITERGARIAASGAAFAELLAHTLVNYSVTYEWHWSTLGWSRPAFSEHLSAISAAIGIPIVFRGADFYPASNLNYMRYKVFGDATQTFSGSFAEHMSRLIGWSETVPSMTHNLYINNGTIYIIERGYEQNTRTVTDNMLALRPAVTKYKRRTEWANSQYQSVVPKEISSSDTADNNQPFSGTITWGTASLTYEDGYLTQEVDGTRTVTYTYTDMTDGKRLSVKTAVDTNAGTCIETTYSYKQTGENWYLSQEEIKTYQGSDNTGSLIDKTRTVYVPIGNGWYGSTTYDYYDQEISNSLSQGAPGNRASQYTIDAANNALKPAGQQQPVTVALNGVARARQTYPVADLTTLQKIAGILDRLEGRTEVMMSCEVVGGNHIYTYDDKIVYGNNTYYIVSNAVTQTFNSIRQSITAVRWL